MLLIISQKISLIKANVCTCVGKVWSCPTILGDALWHTPCLSAAPDPVGQTTMMKRTDPSPSPAFPLVHHAEEVFNCTTKSYAKGYNIKCLETCWQLTEESTVHGIMCWRRIVNNETIKIEGKGHRARRKTSGTVAQRTNLQWILEAQHCPLVSRDALQLSLVNSLVKVKYICLLECCSSDKPAATAESTFISLDFCFLYIRWQFTDLYCGERHPCNWHSAPQGTSTGWGGREKRRIPQEGAGQATKCAYMVRYQQGAPFSPLQVIVKIILHHFEVEKPHSAALRQLDEAVSCFVTTNRMLIGSSKQRLRGRRVYSSRHPSCTASLASTGMMR